MLPMSKYEVSTNWILSESGLYIINQIYELFDKEMFWKWLSGISQMETYLLWRNEIKTRYTFIYMSIYFGKFTNLISAFCKCKVSLVDMILQHKHFRILHLVTTKSTSNISKSKNSAQINKRWLSLSLALFVFLPRSFVDSFVCLFTRSIQHPYTQTTKRHFVHRKMKRERVGKVERRKEYLAQWYE